MVSKKQKGNRGITVDGSVSRHAFIFLIKPRLFLDLVEIDLPLPFVIISKTVYTAANHGYRFMQHDPKQSKCNTMYNPSRFL